MDTVIRPAGCQGQWAPCCPSTSGRPHLHASGDAARRRQLQLLGRRFTSQQACAAANVLQADTASATDSDDPAAPLADAQEPAEDPGVLQYCAHKACASARARTISMASEAANLTQE